MNDDRQTQSDDEAFAQRAKELLDAEGENLSAPVRSKLNQARQAALDELPAEKSGSFGGFNLGPVSVVMMIFSVSVMLWFFDLTLIEETEQEPVAAAEEQVTPDDFDMLLSVADLELMNDLDFYTWLGEELESDEDTTG
ncbi:MAG: hypothetical protein OEU86_07810 [Gammaproteobacteria bacterium]|nr:hypothetical protein [Gammaproteobacteria bacterium]